MKTTENIWRHKPNLVVENSKANALWDFKFRTDRQASSQTRASIITQANQ